MNSLALKFVKVTEQAALAASQLVGKEDKIAVDQAAVDAMRETFATINIKGEIVIGEGPKDKAPALYTGEKVGCGSKELDIAVDPVEGTDLAANDLPNSLAMVAASDKGNLFKAPDMYMDKIAVGPEAKGIIDLTATPTENIKAIAKAKGVDACELTVVILDRHRHKELIKEVRNTGAKVKLINAVDSVAGIVTALGEIDVDVLMGIGGAPEGVLTAAALKCLGGDMQVQLHPRNQSEINQALKMGISDINKVFTIDDLVTGENIIFAMTGITDGELLTGVQENKTHSLVISSQPGNQYIREIRTLSDNQLTKVSASNKQVAKVELCS
ncbi:class II fructose-bisphosphatase [Halanaerobaculum tunisiense]